MSYGLRTVRRSAPLLSLLVLSAAPASGQIRTTFEVHSIEGGCLVDGQDPWPAGDPERYFRMGVFDAGSSAVLSACPSGCSGDADPATLDGSTLDLCGWSEGCGVWDFPDQSIQKITPDQSGVFFYFGLFDEDNDEDDSLGDHWFFTSNLRAQTQLNNNLSPYYADNPITALCSARDVEGVGDPNNFSVTYSVRFEDLSPPVAPGTPAHVDDTVPDLSLNDDDKLEFTWTPGDDPNSGLSGHRFDLWDATAQSYVFLDSPCPSSQVTICPSGCDGSYVPIDGHDYWFRVRARNGGVVELLAPGSATSDWTVVRQADGAVAVGPLPDGATPFRLSPPRPNPSAGRVTLEYSLDRPARATMRIHDVQGRRVADLLDANREAGPHVATWDGRDTDGRRVAPGVYFVRLESGGSTALQRLVVRN